MKTRYLAPLLAAATPALFASGCNTVKAQAAFKDGNKLYKEENYRKAIELYERAVALKPEMAEAHFYLASSQQALYRPGKDDPENTQRLDQAVEHYKRSLELNKFDTDNLKKVRTNTLGALTGLYSEKPLENYETALSYALELVKDNPSDTKNLYAIANLYEKINGQAEQYLKYGFRELSWITLEDDQRSMTIELYDQGEFRNSLGVFASQRDPEQPVQSSGPVHFYRTSIGAIGVCGSRVF